MNKQLLWACILFFFTGNSYAQHSVARQWNELILQAVREDFARPPVVARTMYYSSLAMYEAWACFDTTHQAKHFVMGQTVGGQTFPYTEIAMPANIEAARKEAISYAVFQVIRNKFLYSPNAFQSVLRFNVFMADQGYDFTFSSTDYSNGSPAALGNLIGEYINTLAYNDGANELNNYQSQNYLPANLPLYMEYPGNPTLSEYNSWQPLHIEGALDQNGNPIPSTQIFQSPEWGRLRPFALKEEDKTVYYRGSWEYPVYHDPGPPLELNPVDTSDIQSKEFKWANALVAAWGSHHDPNDGVIWDISPAAIGNLQIYPFNVAEYHNFYNFEDGGDNSTGHAMNPVTGMPYASQWIPRGDYTRVIAQYWADGPVSETPPGHWYVLLNEHVSDHSMHLRQFAGKGPVMDALEWDIKAYLTLGGAVHDAAITAWGIKGWYDGIRPISSLRYMGAKGQCSNPDLPSFDPAGVPLMPGFIELVETGDPLAGPNNEHIGKIKFYSWKGHSAIVLPDFEVAGAGWVLAENWTTYQQKTFVTPPFAGFVSGHSTFSRAAADALTYITGNMYFPGGLAEIFVAADTNHIMRVEKGPSMDMKIQWATYRDAADQTALSRIWGGIHPPYDDIPGRYLGALCAQSAFENARLHFYNDADHDGFYSYEDCNDLDAQINPAHPEVCDGKDNNCNGESDEQLMVQQFYIDNDGDGFGSLAFSLDTCWSEAPAGFSVTYTDCNDLNPLIHPNATEVEDGEDNNCDGLVDNTSRVLDIAVGRVEAYPTLVTSNINIRYNVLQEVSIKILNSAGVEQKIIYLGVGEGIKRIDCSTLPSGMYILQLLPQKDVAGNVFARFIVK